MRKYLLWVGFGVFFTGVVSAQSPSDPCASAQAWRARVCQFASSQLKHTAWGFEHGKRDYLLARTLSENEGLAIDDDVLFAAALLHDVGGFPPYEQEGVDHALRSVQVVGEVLEPLGFPMAKLEAVKKAIRHHSYYDPTRPETVEGIVLHDADSLNFLGALSVTRLLSIVERESATPSIAGAVQLLERFLNEIPAKLYGGSYTQEELSRRVMAMRDFLTALRRESFNIL